MPMSHSNAFNEFQIVRSWVACGVDSNPSKIVCEDHIAPINVSVALVAHWLQQFTFRNRLFLVFVLMFVVKMLFVFHHDATLLLAMCGRDRVPVHFRDRAMMI